MDIIDKFRDPQRVKQFVLDPKNSHPDAHVPLMHAWSDLSLGTGFSGILLLSTRLEQLGVIDGEISHRYVLAIGESLQRNGTSNFSLFGGLAGIAFAIHEASFAETRYQKMLTTLHEFLLNNLQEAYISPLSLSPTASGFYDVIQGAAGVGRYLLEHVNKPRFYEALEQLIYALIALTKPKEIQGKEVPGWFLPPTDVLNQKNHSQTRGSFNLGLAHGIPGVLSFLSISLLREVEVEGQRDAIARIVEWIQRRSFRVNSQIVWPYQITWEEEVDKETKPCKSRDAWCYGTPGVATSLIWAGKALKQEQLISLAKESLDGVFTRTKKDWNLPGPMLCHGLAGLYCIGRFMDKDVDALKEQVLMQYNPETPFGFSDVEWSKKGKLIVVHKPGFLEGAAGLLLSILSDQKPHSNWHLPLML